MRSILQIFTLVLILFNFSCTNQGDRRPAELGGGVEVEAGGVRRGPPGGGEEYRAALPGIGIDFNRACRGFIAEDGSIGPWGREFLQAMRDVEVAYGAGVFFGNLGERMIKMGSRCGSSEHFASLTRSQQEHVWVWLWASIAQSESSCRRTAQVAGIYNARLGYQNIADGLLQLEYRTSTRNASGRDTRFCPNNADSQAIRFQARCGASIMARAHSGRFLYTEGRGYTYWDKLRRNNGNIFKLLKKHPLCR